MDYFFRLDFDAYGISLSTEPVYFFFSWGSILVALLSVVGYKLYKKAKKKGRK